MPGLIPARSSIAILLVSAAFTIDPTVAATAYARRYEIASCHRHCSAERGYDRCMARCLNRRSPPAPVAAPYLPEDYPPQRRRLAPFYWRLYEQLLELFVRFMTEMLGGVLGAGVITLRIINRAARRSRALRISEQLTRRAKALEREATELRARSEAIRRNDDI